MELRLDVLPIGQKARIVKVERKGTLYKRMLDMGLVKGATIYVECKAPLGDPIKIVLKGFHLSLRKKEAHCVIVEKI